MIIYKTVNVLNGKFYIGQDSKNNPEYIGSGTLLKRAIEKYGRDKFIKETLEVCSTQEELNEREKYWIKETKARELGYNIADGGCGGNTYTEETRERVSQFFKGRYVSPETIEKRKKTIEKRKQENPDRYKLSEERKKAIGDFHRGKNNSQKQNNYEVIKKFTNHSPEFMEIQKEENKQGEKGSMWGKKHTKETREKMSTSNSRYWLGKKQPPEAVEKRKQTRENRKQENPDRYKRTEELKENQRTKMVGKGNPFYGQTHTPETRERLKQARLNKTPEEMLKIYIKFHITRKGYEPSEEQKIKKLEEYKKKKED
jgi:group I intron endonuclease